MSIEWEWPTWMNRVLLNKQQPLSSEVSHPTAAAEVNRIKLYVQIVKKIIVITTFMDYSLRTFLVQRTCIIKTCHFAHVPSTWWLHGFFVSINFSIESSIPIKWCGILGMAGPFHPISIDDSDVFGFLPWNPPSILQSLSSVRPVMQNYHLNTCLHSYLTILPTYLPSSKVNLLFLWSLTQQNNKTTLSRIRNQFTQCAMTNVTKGGMRYVPQS